MQKADLPATWAHRDSLKQLTQKGERMALKSAITQGRNPEHRDDTVHFLCKTRGRQQVDYTGVHVKKVRLVGKYTGHKMCVSSF